MMAGKNAKNAETKVETIKVTKAQIAEIQARAVAQYKVEQTARKPIPVDISENVQLNTKLKIMNKTQLIKYGEDEFSLKIDPVLTNNVIIAELLKLDGQRRGEAAKVNEESLNKSVSADDPPIKVKFFNLQSPQEVINFSFAGPKGMRGKAFTGPHGEKLGNPNGHKKCPKYELHPGEEYIIPLSLKEHLESLTFTHYKTVVDPVTGQIAGNIPLLKPKYILNPVISKAQLIALQKT